MTKTQDWLAHRAQISPQKIALVYGQQSWTYRELDELVASTASQVATAGIEAGHNVAILMPNRPEYVCLIHALARIGAVLVPLNVRLTSAELDWQVRHADCSVVICSAQTETVAAGLAENGRRVLTVDRPVEPSVEALGEMAGNAEAWSNRPLALETVQGLVFTSGTTGRPKGTMLTYANHFWSASASAFRLGTLPTDRWLVCMPLYHVGGVAIIFRCCLYGTTVVLQSGFDPSAVSRALHTDEITLISLVPTMLQRLLERHSQSLISSQLRCILLGGAAASESLLTRCLDLDLPVATTYGLTEATSQVATATPADVRQKPGSVGKPLLFVEVRIIGEGGQELPCGQIGEIVVRGPTVMAGYFMEPQATAKTLIDGWLHTGDMGYLDEESDLWVVQRRTDLIVTGGENVYPAEVERILRQHPGVAEACVVGLDDPEWGQRVASAIVVSGAEPGLTEAALVDFCRERLAGYKCPCLFRFVDALPQTASGKVIRSQVRELIGERSF